MRKTSLRRTSGSQIISTKIRSRRAQMAYGSQLRKVAKAVGDIISGTYDGSSSSVDTIKNTLSRYADLITPWAQRAAQRMAETVALSEKKQWMQLAQHTSGELRLLMNNTAVGHTTDSIVNEQVKLIKSLPLEAANRVDTIHARAVEAMLNGERPGRFASEIARSGEVAKSRANMIARTEIGRSQTALTQARALNLGSEGYIWRTADDGDVRHSHALMEGKFVRWDNPPTLDGMTGHAGTLPNCRCYCEVVLPGLTLQGLQ
ncbi:phage head morphogenesis protein [Salmonella enterica]|uniref:Phage head morphogenesis protein n=1 Tax=Salmonella diarizonae TaxID=59204 RepID=A0A6Y5LGW2_SALDZ|nr:phage head morphogenesis protein [Salmonella enterica]EBF6639528.1 phage head morphogenesis protein [Salmonella enterica subsp. enterica serovar Reading]EBW6386701.1 phage head morphogenesis protein [Salmonella enterica subsp. enterica serovar Stanley]ECJ2515010.1 phage head morphogenesis protein [Salmonella enterica subsp. diarizonae]EDV4521079.1 phage head morphogenesis protein [Salmonella enterica subsp. enterica]EEO3476940.1 phage head morphogenesis protein [Salmonella enterica subsp. e